MRLLRRVKTVREFVFDSRMSMGEMSFFGSQRLVFGSLQVFPSTNGSPGESTFSGITRRSGCFREGLEFRA